MIYNLRSEIFHPPSSGIMSCWSHPKTIGGIITNPWMQPDHGLYSGNFPFNRNQCAHPHVGAASYFPLGIFKWRIIIHRRYSITLLVKCKVGYNTAQSITFFIRGNVTQMSAFIACPHLQQHFKFGRSYLKGDIKQLLVTGNVVCDWV